jgi:hypothetical protein
MPASQAAVDAVRVPAIATLPRWPYSLSDWTPLFRGVDRCVGAADTAWGVPGSVPRKQVVNAVRVDLTVVPGFVVTPRGGIWNTLSETIGEFIADSLRNDKNVAVAINTNFGYAQPGCRDSVICGFSVSDGDVVCNPMDPPPCNPGGPADVPMVTNVGSMALVIEEGNRAYIVELDEYGPSPIPPGAVWAVAGSPCPAPGGNGCPPLDQIRDRDGEWYPALLVEDGYVLPRPVADPPQIAGRTAIGLSGPDPDTGWPRYLYMVTLDGYENARSPYGGDFSDIAMWLKLVGADKGFNLDGGGSTAMARRSGVRNAPAILMNVPYGNEIEPMVQRPVCSFLGVIADDLPAG